MGAKHYAALLFTSCPHLPLGVGIAPRRALAVSLSLNSKRFSHQVEEEFAHLLFDPEHVQLREVESPAQQLMREASKMISKEERERVLMYLLLLLKPSFIKKTVDWKPHVRDFILDIMLNERVLTQLTTEASLVDEFWSVLIEILETTGLPGQRWVAQTVRWLVRAAENSAVQRQNTDLVYSVCQPRVIEPLVHHLAPGALKSASAVAKRMLTALEYIPDAVLSLVKHLPAEKQNDMLFEMLQLLLERRAEMQDPTARNLSRTTKGNNLGSFFVRACATFLSLPSSVMTSEVLPS